MCNCSDRDSNDRKNLLLERWFHYSFEIDKILLTLSTAGIGLLFAIFYNKGHSFLVYIAALFFLLTMISILITLCIIDKEHIYTLTTDDQNENKIKKFNKWLSWLDRFSQLVFSVGVIFSAVVIFLSL